MPLTAVQALHSTTPYYCVADTNADTAHGIVPVSAWTREYFTAAAWLQQYLEIVAPRLPDMRFEVARMYVPALTLLSVVDDYYLSHPTAIRIEG